MTLSSNGRRMRPGVPREARGYEIIARSLEIRDESAGATFRRASERKTRIDVSALNRGG